jgi:hypothetical protein
MTKFEELTLKYLNLISWQLIDIAQTTVQVSANLPNELTPRSHSELSVLRLSLHNKLRDEMELAIKSGK